MSSVSAGPELGDEEQPGAHRRQPAGVLSRGGRRVRALLATPPLIVWLLCGLTFGLGTASAIAFPPYAGLDEPQHVDMVVSLLEGDGWPGPGDRNLSQGVAHASNLFYSHLTVRPFSDLPIPPRGQRKSWEQFGGDASAGGLPNQMVQHPPLYYATAALLVKAWPGAWQDMPFTQFVFALRLVSAFIMAWLPMLAWGLARALRAPPPVPVAAAALVLAVPGVVRLGGMVNNDGLLAVLTAAVMIGAVRAAHGDLSRRTGAWIGALLGLALLTKGFALALIPIVGIGYAVGWWRRRSFGWQPLLIGWGVAFVVGGWWWLRNLLLYGKVQPQGAGAAAVAQIRGQPLPHRPPVSGFLSAVENLLPRSFFEPTGAAGWSTVSESAAVMLGFVVIALVVVALLTGVRGRGHRLLLVLLLLPVAAYVLLITSNSASVYFRYGSTPVLQGRYLYGIVPVLAVLVGVAVDALLTGAGRGARRVVRWSVLATVPLCLAVAAALEVHAQLSLLNAFWAPAPGTSLSTDVSDMLTIAPWPRWASLAPFGAALLFAAAIAVAAVVRLVREARGGGAPAPVTAELPATS